MIPIVFVLCIVIAGVGAYFTRAFIEKMTARHIFPLALPLVFSIVAVAWGCLFAWPGPVDTEPAWHLEVLRWLFFSLYPSLCILSIWRSPGFRLLAASLIPLSLFIAIFALALASAAVTGD
jgi:hypothetical protein